MDFYIIGDDQLSGWTKKKCQSTFESQTCTKKGSWSLFGGLLLVWSPAAFWILMKPLLQEVCSANQWDALNSKTPTATLVNRMGPILLHDNTWLHITQPALQKLNELGYEILPHPPCSLDLLTTTTSSSILTTFHKETASTINRRQKILSKSSSNPKAGIFVLQQ